MKKLMILGAGGHGKVVGEIAKECGYEISFLDDRIKKDVVGTIDELFKFVDSYDEFIVGIGANKKRKQLTEMLKSYNVKIATLVHPTAYVSHTAEIGQGTVVEPETIVNSNSIIGEGCIISVGAIIDHDAIVNPFAHINAGAICKSGSTVESEEKIDAGEIVQGF